MNDQKWRTSLMGTVGLSDGFVLRKRNTKEYGYQDEIGVELQQQRNEEKANQEYRIEVQLCMMSVQIGPLV